MQPVYNIYHIYPLFNRTFYLMWDFSVYSIDFSIIFFFNKDWNAYKSVVVIEFVQLRIFFHYCRIVFVHVWLPSCLAASLPDEIMHKHWSFFCRDISCYISVVFEALKLKLGTCNLLKSECWIFINHWNETILKGAFSFAHIKWATSGLVRAAQNWFPSKRYVVKIIRKNSQLKKSIFTTL